jgi:hypothetical protein
MSATQQILRNKGNIYQDILEQILRIFGHNMEIVTQNNCIMNSVFNKQYKNYQIKAD